METAIPTHQEIADGLLWPLWMGMDPAFKSKYARNIWQQFEDQIKSAATSNETLSKILGKVCLRLGSEIAREHVAAVNALVSCGHDRAVLKMLRSEATALVLLVRLKNDERRAEIQERIAQRATDVLSEEEQARVEAQKQRNETDLFGGMN